MTDVVRVPTEKNRGGAWVRIGDEEYRVAPLGFRALQELGDKIMSLKDMQQIPTREQMGVVIEIVHSAMQRNYPSMTAEQVIDMLDVGNFSPVLNSVMGASGFVRGDNSGNPSASIGTESTSA
jgi:hypothetical protein